MAPSPWEAGSLLVPTSVKVLLNIRACSRWTSAVLLLCCAVLFSCIHMRFAAWQSVHEHARQLWTHRGLCVISNEIVRCLYVPIRCQWQRHRSCPSIWLRCLVTMSVIYLYAITAICITVASCVDSGMPERTYAFGASLLLALPIVRHMMSWMGVVPASKHVMLDVLSKASGGAMPEGIAGIFTGASRCICPAQQLPAFFNFSLLQMTCWHRSGFLHPH